MKISVLNAALGFKRLVWPLFLTGFLFTTLTAFKFSSPPRVLIFSRTCGFHHTSIPAGIAAIQQLGKINGFETDTTTDNGWFTPENLKKYKAVIFLNTTDTSDVLLNPEQKTAFIHYINSGGGFVGVHAASDAEYQWEWYGKLVGAYFTKHPKIQQAVLHVEDPKNIATRHLPKEWTRTDEWYNFKNIGKDLHVLLTIDESTYQGGTNGSFHPMAWYHEFDGGRAFYTELGHTAESYSDPLYLNHLLGGILYAMGK
ncbi:MAG TPA: ThuA domain-containing protein [Flavisolibacter sp.]|nr:ThuA domain-containing protein [Flavisolibacter sp.]